MLLRTIFVRNLGIAVVVQVQVLYRNTGRYEKDVEDVLRNDITYARTTLEAIRSKKEAQGRQEQQPIGPIQKDRRGQRAINAVAIH